MGRLGEPVRKGKKQRTRKSALVTARSLSRAHRSFAVRSHRAIRRCEANIGLGRASVNVRARQGQLRWEYSHRKSVMSNGVGTTRPDEKTPQTTTRTRSEKREPQQAPMEQYTKVSNRRLEEWARKAGVKMGILMMVQRQTVGWQRMWWTTTVTDLATKIGRGRQSTSKWLGKLVEAGEVVRRDLENDKIMLALAGEAEEEGHVENSGGVSSVDDRGCRRSTTGGCRRSATPPPPPGPAGGGPGPDPKARGPTKEKKKTAPIN